MPKFRDMVDLEGISKAFIQTDGRAVFGLREVSRTLLSVGWLLLILVEEIREINEMLRLQVLTRTDKTSDRGGRR